MLFQAIVNENQTDKLTLWHPSLQYHQSLEVAN